MTEPSDEALMRAYVQQGDRSAFEALFRRYAGRLLGYFSRTAGPAHAQDMLQKTFLHVHRARHDFRDGAPVRPWIFAIAANVRREHWRRRGRKPETALDPDRHVPAVEPSTSSPTDRAVRRALEQLPEGQREVVVLHWYEGLTFSEVSRMVGASPSAVKVRAHRAYKQLRAILGGTDE